jgi:benzaldehyde dehydrogenase (NAD)
VAPHPTGIVHINHQTVSDEASVPFCGIGASGTGARFGGAPAKVDAFTETRWATVREPRRTRSEAFRRRPRTSRP